MKCRHCDCQLTVQVLDLGFAPPSNFYLSKEDLHKPEKHYPLKVKICDKCWLAQTEDFLNEGDLFDENYAYFSSTSSSWLKHASDFSKKIVSDLKLDTNSFVIEIASNDGYLLKNFLSEKIPCLGIEPTESTARSAKLLGIPVIQEFFSEKLAIKIKEERSKADLIVGNNVYAHVPNVNDFTLGIKHLLKPEGTVTLEFPHILQLLKHNQFDTIYHEHFSYLSLYAVQKIFQKAGLRVWHLEELKTHGGSLRVYGCHIDSKKSTKKSVSIMAEKEKSFGLLKKQTYKSLQIRAEKIKNDLLTFLIAAKNANKKVVAYGAAAKGNTLLNYAGVKHDLISAVFDASKSKQNKMLPGSHIEIHAPDKLSKFKPDYILILPWNIAQEIRQMNSNLENLGAKFVVAIPELTVL